MVCMWPRPPNISPPPRRLFFLSPFLPPSTPSSPWLQIPGEQRSNLDLSACRSVATVAAADTLSPTAANQERRLRWRRLLLVSRLFYQDALVMYSALATSAAATAEDH